METIWIMVLGAIQGATEFLPVSSSGHLAIGQMIIKKTNAQMMLSDQPLILEILLHFATLVAVLAVYRREVLAALKGIGSGIRAIANGNLKETASGDDGVNLAIAIVIGTVPTGIIGFFIRDAAGRVSTSPSGLGATYLACACLLLCSRWWTGGEKRLTWRTALIIGVVQGLAVLPGISRSGATIVAALALGLKREEAAKFSFLLSVPAIIAAAVLEIDPASLARDGRMLEYAAGAVVAFAVGLIALITLIKLVKGGRLWFFAPYVAAIGIAAFFLL